jgi:MscS family membrane protein
MQEYSLLWLFSEFVSLLAMASLMTWIAERVWQYLQKNYRQAKEPWSSTFFASWHLPLIFILWSFFFCFGLKKFLGDCGLGEDLFLVEKLWPLSLVTFLTWGSLKWKGALQERYLAKLPRNLEMLDKASIDLIGKSSTILLLVLAVLTGLQVLEIPWQALVALSSGGLVALGFAGRDMAANLFGGAMIYLTRPFTIGNVISIPDKKLDGEVEIIGWYQTKVRSFEKMPIYVPNSVFSQSIVINTSRITHRKINFVLSLSLEDINRSKEVIDAVLAYVQEHPEVDPFFKPTAFLTSIAPSVDIQVAAYTLRTDIFEFKTVQQEILLKCIDLIGQLNVRLAIPLSRVELIGKD